MRCVTAKFVPRLLTAEQKDDRMSICTDLRDRTQNDSNFMTLVNTGNQCWVYGHDPETKQMSSQWSISLSRPTKARQVKSNIKTTFIAFYDIDRLVHHEFVPIGQTVNKEFYKQSSNASAMLCADIALRSNAPATGSCTTTTPLPTALSPQMNFWRNTTFRHSHNLPTPMNMLRVTSSCSHN